MYCQNCGKFIDYDAKYCKECEAELFAPKTPVNDEPKAADTQPTPEDTTPTDTQVPPTGSQVPPTGSQVPPTGSQVPPTGSQVPPTGYYYNPNYYQPPMNPYAYSTEPEPQNRMFGFGKALASTILGFFSYFFSVFAMTFVTEDVPETAGGILMLIAIGLTVTTFIFAMQSIKCFQRRKATCAKPIATLILGIVGISFAGLSIFLLSLALIVFFVNFHV